jgi:hypothetical protein
MDTKISANIRKYPNPYSKGWFGKRGASIPRIAAQSLERIAGIGPKQKEKENGNENE